LKFHYYTADFSLKKSFFIRIKVIVILVFIICSASIFAQSENTFLNNSIKEKFDRIYNNKKLNFHTSVQPFVLSNLENDLFKDSSLKDNFKNYVGKSTQGNKFNVTLIPLLDISGGGSFGDSSDNSLINNTGLGLLLKSKLGNRFFLEGSFLANRATYPGYINSFIDLYNIIPGMGYARPTKSGFFNLDYSGYLSFDASKYFNFQAGQGKNFVGEGYRSLLVSDNSFSYPFFKISTTIWNIKYINLFNVWKDIRFTDGQLSNHFIKYSTTHYLSWNATKRLNIGIFESIVWQSSDTLSKRGFDVNYLNPVIFYRPVEYATGSSDNAMLGLNISYKITSQSKLYTQLIIDEFLVEEVRARRGWWANKFGGQLGIKIYDLAKLEGLNLRVEANAVRPFTYSHGSIYQSYLHYNQPMAHPLGSNFFEMVGNINFSKNSWRFENQINYAVYGRDSLNINQGGDIFKSYANPNSIYGNKIGQGIKHKLFINQIKTSYLLDRKSNLKIEAMCLFRSEKIYNATSNNLFISVGISTTLGNKYFDF
jgi:hypothetical protein